MSSVSEASQASIISPHVKGVETETFLMLSKISEQKDFLKNILKKYNAKSPEDIEKMIEQGKIDEHPAYEDYLPRKHQDFSFCCIDEHPAYEDYLSALSYEQNIKDLKKMLDNFVKRI
jgi:hypothetical protein